jgi:hypothetical protein
MVIRKATKYTLILNIEARVMPYIREWALRNLRTIKEQF